MISGTSRLLVCVGLVLTSGIAFGESDSHKLLLVRDGMVGQSVPLVTTVSARPLANAPRDARVTVNMVVRSSCTTVDGLDAWSEGGNLVVRPRTTDLQSNDCVAVVEPLRLVQIVRDFDATTLDRSAVDATATGAVSRMRGDGRLGMLAPEHFTRTTR